MKATTLAIATCVWLILVPSASAGSTTPFDFESVHIEYPKGWQLSYSNGTARFVTKRGTIELSVARDRQKLQKQLKSWLFGTERQRSKSKRETRWATVAGKKTWTLTVHRNRQRGATRAPRSSFPQRMVNWR